MRAYCDEDERRLVEEELALSESMKTKARLGKSSWRWPEEVEGGSWSAGVVGDGGSAGQNHCCWEQEGIRNKFQARHDGPSVKEMLAGSWAWGTTQTTMRTILTVFIPITVVRWTYRRLIYNLPY